MSSQNIYFKCANQSKRKNPNFQVAWIYESMKYKI